MKRGFLTNFKHRHDTNKIKILNNQSNKYMINYTYI